MSANRIWCVPRLSQLQHLSFQLLFFRQFYRQHKSLARCDLSVSTAAPTSPLPPPHCLPPTLHSFSSLSSNLSLCSAPPLPLSPFHLLPLSPSNDPSSPPLMSPYLPCPSSSSPLLHNSPPLFGPHLGKRKSYLA